MNTNYDHLVTLTEPLRKRKTAPMTKQQTTFENLPNEKRERVLTEATREFADHGYHQASVNRIVGRLGIAKGSLFKYFGNKQGLFEYLFGHAVSQFKKPLKAIRDTPDGNFFDQIEQSFLASAAFTASHPHIYSIYLKMLFQENFPLRETFLSEIRGAHAKYLRALIEEGINSGELRSDLDVNETIFTLHAILDRFLQSHAIPSMDNGLVDAHQTPEAKARAIADFLRRGLGA